MGKTTDYVRKLADYFKYADEWFNLYPDGNGEILVVKARKLLLDSKEIIIELGEYISCAAELLKMAGGIINTKESMLPRTKKLEWQEYCGDENWEGGWIGSAEGCDLQYRLSWATGNLNIEFCCAPVWETVVLNYEGLDKLPIPDVDDEGESLKLLQEYCQKHFDKLIWSALTLGELNA